MKNGKAFGQRVRQWRERRRLSTQELSDRTGISYQTLWRIERGKHKDPGLFTAALIARELGVSLDLLAGLYAGTDTETEQLAAAVA